MAKIDILLNECIERIRRGETAAQCLASYPDNAAELEPLLKTVLSLNSVSELKARPEFRAYAKAQVLATVRGKAKDQPVRRFSSLRWTWAAIAVSVFAMVSAGGGTVLASAHAIPGDPLYSVKRTVERAQLAATPSDVGKAKLLANFADRRVQEIGTMVQEGKMDRVDRTSASMAKDLEQIGNTIGSGKSASAKENKNPVMSAATTSTPATDAVTPAADTTTAFGSAGQGQTVLTAPRVTTMTSSHPLAASTVATGQKVAGSASDKSDDSHRNDDVKNAHNADEVRQALLKQAERQKQYLQGLLEKASPKDKEAIQRTIDKLTAGYDLATKED